MSRPREGLPSCISLIEFDGRTAHFIDKASCGRDHRWPSRFMVGAGPVVEYREYGGHGAKVPGFPAAQAAILVETNDPDEALNAYERGAEYVRTGRYRDE